MSTRSPSPSSASRPTASEGNQDLMDVPPVRYATTPDGLDIAYMTYGEGRSLAGFPRACDDRLVAGASRARRPRHRLARCAGSSSSTRGTGLSARLSGTPGFGRSPSVGRLADCGAARACCRRICSTGRWRALPGGAALTEASGSTSPQRYLDEALDLMERHALIPRRRSDWRSVREGARQRCADAQDSVETYPAIESALSRLGDGHSFFSPPGPAGARRSRPVPTTPTVHFACPDNLERTGSYAPSRSQGSGDRRPTCSRTPGRCTT